MMKETFQNLIAYLKNPVLEKDSNESLNYRFKEIREPIVSSKAVLPS